MVRRTGSGTATPCPSLGHAEKDSLRRKLRQQSAESLREPWVDYTKGSKKRRRSQLKDCGEECFGCPNKNRPMYPVCTKDCEPRCAGIAAAMGYAKRLGAESVRDNLMEAMRECEDLRSQTKERRRSSRSSAKKDGRSRRRSRARSPSGRRKSRRGSRGSKRRY